MSEVVDHGFVPLKEFESVDHVVDAWFIGVPFGERDSTLMPHTADSAYLGDANRGALYWCIWDAMAIILSILQMENHLGGILPTFNIKDNAEQWHKVLQALANKGNAQNPQLEQFVQAMLEKHTVRNALFSETINRAVATEKERMKKKRADEARNKLSEARASSASASTMRAHTLTMVTTNRSVGRLERWIQMMGRPMMRSQNLFSDGWDANERAERISGTGADQDSGGGGGGDEDSNLLNRELSLGGEVTMDGSSLRASVQGMAMTEGGALKDVAPKFELVGLAIPRLGADGEGEGDEDDDRQQQQQQGGDRGPVKRSRQFFDELGMEACDDEVINEMGGFMFILCKMDPTINGGKAIEMNLREAALRRQFAEENIRNNAGPGRQFMGASLGYDPKRDHHRDLLVGKYSNFPTLTMTKRRLVETVLLYSGLPADESAVDLLTRSSFPSDSASPLNPNMWATLENAVRVLKNAKCDVSGLTPSQIFAGYEERASLGAQNPKRDKFSMMNLTAPKLNGGGPYYQAYKWSVRNHALVDKRPGHFGILDQWFPFIDPKKVQTREQLFSVEVRAAQRHDDQAAQEQRDPLGMFHKGTTVHMTEQQKVFNEGVSLREWRAPYETDDNMQHAYYAAGVLTAETLKSYTDDPAKWDQWMAAQRRQEALCYPGFKENMSKDARVNRFALAMNRWGDHARKTMSNPSLPLFLNDCGRSLDPNDVYGPRDPQYPPLDGFAHDKIRNNYYLRQIKGVEAPLVIQRCQKVGTTCFHFKPGRLNPMFVLSGTAGTGKTYVIKAVTSMMVAGMWSGQNHTSEGALTVAGSVDEAICTDEGAGIIENKKIASARKTELAKTAINGMGVVSAARSAYKKDAMGNKTLTLERTDVCHNNAYLIATNNGQDDIDEAMVARCIFIEKKEAFSLAVELTFENIEQMSRAFQTSQRLQQYMVYLVHKGVQCGYIPDFTQMPMVDIILQNLSRWLLSMGVTPQENNNWDRVHNKIKIAIHDSVARNAIIETFNLPGGSRFMVNEGGWELSFLREVSVKLFPTLQIIFWEVMEHEHEWIGDVNMIVEMLKAALKVAGYEWIKDHTASDQYMYDVHDEVRWRRRIKHDDPEENAGNQQQQEQGQDGPRAHVYQKQRKTTLIDLNWVRLQETGTLWQQISNNMPAWCRAPPSRIKGHFMRMSHSAMFIPSKAPYLPKTAADLAPVRDREIEFTPSGLRVTSYDTATRDDTCEGKPMPIIEMSNNGRFGTNTIYVATDAPAVLRRVDLIRGLLFATCSGVMKPRKIALPITHREYHDVIETITLNQEVIDRVVDLKDARQKRNYRIMMARRGIFDETRLPPIGVEGEYDDDDEGSGPPPAFRDEGEAGSVIEDDDDDELEEGTTIGGGDATWLDEEEEEEPTRPTTASRIQLTAEELDPNRMVRIGGLKLDWRSDRKYLSAKYGIQVADQSAVSAVGMAFMSDKLDQDMSAAEWEKVQERVKSTFSGRMKFISVDPDLYSASVRWKRCGMPLEVNGRPVRMPDWSFSLDCYLQYMREHNLPMRNLNYPADEIAARSKGSSIMEVIHGMNAEDFESYFPPEMLEEERKERLKRLKQTAEELEEKEKEYDELNVRQFETERVNRDTDRGMAMAVRGRSRMARVLHAKASQALRASRARGQQQDAYQRIQHNQRRSGNVYTLPGLQGRE